MSLVIHQFQVLHNCRFNDKEAGTQRKQNFTLQLHNKHTFLKYAYDPADKLVTCPRIKGTAQNEWPIRKIAGNRKPQQDIMVGGWTPVDSKRDHYVWKRGVREVEPAVEPAFRPPSLEYWEKQEMH